MYSIRQNDDYASEPVAPARLGILKIAFAVFLGNLMTGLFAAILYAAFHGK
jgi:hypothetical protein